MAGGGAEATLTAFRCAKEARGRGHFGMSDELSELPAPPNADALMQVEVLPPDLVPHVERGVSLRGEAAINVTDSLGSLARTGVGVGHLATASSYRLVPSEKAAKGLADGSLRWATANKGDASVLIKEKATGRIAGQASLQKVEPNPATILGPAAWEAMAMATQQHYLVEINDKLESIERGVDEVLSRMDDDKLGTLEHASRIARASLDMLDQGRTLSQNRIQDVRERRREPIRGWHKLHRRADPRTLPNTGAAAEAPRTSSKRGRCCLKPRRRWESAAPYYSPSPTRPSRNSKTPPPRSAGGRSPPSRTSEPWPANFSSPTATGAPPRPSGTSGTRATPPRRRCGWHERPPPSSRSNNRSTTQPAGAQAELASPPRPPDALLVTANDDGTVEVSPERANDTPLVS